MSDHPVRSGKVLIERQVGPDGRPQAADAVLDVGRAKALGRRNRLDHIRRVDPAGCFLGRGDGVAVLVHVHGFTDMRGPAAAGPPHHGPRFQIIARQYLHAFVPAFSPDVSTVAAQAANRSSASDNTTTSPTTMIAGLCTFSRSTRSPRSASSVRIAQIGRAPSRERGLKSV